MTETVAVVFTDLVGSTELLASLGDDAFDRLRRDHFEVLRSASAAHGGEEVKNLGDGLMVVFRSASDAIAAAVAMHQGVERRGRKSSLPAVGLKVGAAIGDATHEEDDWFGIPVVEAARLCAACEPGQLLVTDLMRLMAGSRVEEEIKQLGSRVLKGLPEPVAVSEVRWETVAGDDGAPFPAALTTPSAFPFAGRGRARDELAEALSAGAAGQARTVFVAGEPGIGKTRLVAEAAVVAHDNGAVVLLGRSEDEIDSAFRPFAEALDQLVRHANEDLVREHLAAVGAVLGPLVPALATRGGDEPAGAMRSAVANTDSERLQLFHAVVDLVGRQCEVAPLVLVLDDVHWADRSSLLLLRHLVVSLAEARLTILATYRDTDVDRAHPLSKMLADFRRIPAVGRIALTGLNQAEVVEYLALAGGQDLEPEGVELGRQLAEITSGNPFFVSETLRHLAESGAIVHRDGRWVAEAGAADEIGVPEGIREVVGRRLSTLDPELERLLSVAAVAGGHFDSAIVAAVAGIGIDDAIDGLDVACGRSLVAEDTELFGWYRFAHALVRQTLLEELSTTKRLRLHRSVGDELVKVAPDRVEEIAHHYLEAATAGAAEGAVAYAVRAGHQALDRTANEQAAGWFERALEAEEVLEPDAARRCELLLDLGDARNRSEDYLEGAPQHREAAALARTIGRADLLARAAYGYLGPMGIWADLADQERRPLLDEALAALAPGEHLDLRMQLLIKLCNEYVFDPGMEERLACAEEAAAIGRSLDDPHIRWDGIAWQVFARMPLADGDRTEELIDEMEAIEGLDLTRRAETLLLRATARRNRGDLVGAKLDIDRYVDLAGPVGIVRRVVVIGEAASRAQVEGRFADAERLYAELRADSNLDSSTLLAAGGEYWLGFWGADPDELQAGVDRLPESAAAFAELFPTRAVIDLLRGGPDAGRESFETWKTLMPFVPGAFRKHAACWATYPAWRLGDREVAAQLLEIQLPYEGRWPTPQLPQCRGPADVHIGTNLLTLERFEEAERLLRAAVESSASVGSPPWEAFSRLFHALALRGVGRNEEADATAQRSRELASELGMHLVLADLGAAGLGSEVSSGR